MKIIIDGDASPVKEITTKIARKFDLDLLIVFSNSHFGIESNYEKCQIVMVDSSWQSADMEIINRTVKGDIAITGDYGLASLVLGKKAYSISNSGRIFTNDNIDALLLDRHISQQIRKAGGRTKGPQKRSKQDDIKFEEQLTSLILEIIKDI